MKRLIIFLCMAAIAISCGRQTETSGGNDVSEGVVYELNTRQLTPEGTLDAAREILPTLKDAGVDIVWLMPVYPIGEKGRKGTLGSYYAIKDYRDINPEFGTLEDFDEFVEAAHGLGLKVLLDWVANHTSPDHPWVEGKPADWYVRDENGNTIVEYDWTDIAKLNYENSDMRREMQDCMRFWLDRGVDGFRCDMAYIVPQDFWEETIPALRNEYGPLYFLAEGETPWLHEAGFNTSYSWKLHHLLNDIARGSACADSLASYLEWNSREYPADAHRLCFTSNHDENSWAGTEFERMGEAWQVMSVLCWTLPQSQPLIYTGQEIGNDKRFAFFEKDHLESYKTNSYTDFYRSLNALRRDHPCLRSTESEFELLSASDAEFSYRRTLGDDWVKVSVELKAPWSWNILTSSDLVSRVEPPCWWIGMKTPLQLLVQGQDISQWELALEGGKGISIKEVHQAESPNYIFVDFAIAPDAAPGTVSLRFSKDGESFCVPYTFNQREEGSALRESFTTADAIYLIMPDRFVNGDPSNDNSCRTAELADYQAFFGRHGGDIQGIEDQLDYIAGLGMTAIWNTPLLEDNEPRSSYHGYACSDYYNIDPRFGSNWKYREMVSEAHKRGIKIIMDIVTNHCGTHHWWMEDLPFNDWIHQWPEYTHSNCAFSAQNDPYCAEIDRQNMLGGWFDTSMPDMNLDNPYLLQYFKQWAVWWIEWAGLDGLRVDTYPYNEKYPMAEWNKSVLNEYPNLNIVGEVWSNNVPQVAYWQKDNPNKDGFNSYLPSIMDFCLMSAIASCINSDSESWDEGITKVYDSIANDLYFTDVRNMMIFPGNHDTARIGDICRKDPAKMKIVYSLMATLRGFPQIFAGDELMVTSRDLSQGHGGLRVELPLDWESNPLQKELHDCFSTLFQWRKTSDAVINGDTRHFISRDNTYAYFRYTDSEAVFVFVNNNPSGRALPWESYAEVMPLLKGEGRNVLTGEKFVPEGMTVPGKTSLVVEFK
ncbi:MAG: alpha-amylase family glycosyl hydrolase [Candidatus Cryptobacteroides sp.]